MKTSSLKFSASEGMLAFIQMSMILAFASSALEVEGNGGLPSGLSNSSCGKVGKDGQIPDMAILISPTHLISVISGHTCLS